MACIAVGLSLSQTYTAIKAPSAQPKTPVARKLARTYLMTERRRREMGGGYPFHPVERVIR